MLDPSWDATNGVTSQNCDVRLENWKIFITNAHRSQTYKLQLAEPKVEEELRRWALGINLK
jgi:hypothetical protein